MWVLAAYGPVDAAMSDQADDPPIQDGAESAAPRDADGSTAEFDLLSAGLDQPLDGLTESPNPRSTLSDDEMHEHRSRLENVARARDMAKQTDD